MRVKLPRWCQVGDLVAYDPDMVDEATDAEGNIVPANVGIVTKVWRSNECSDPLDRANVLFTRQDGKLSLSTLQSVSLWLVKL